MHRVYRILIAMALLLLSSAGMYAQEDLSDSVGTYNVLVNLREHTPQSLTTELEAANVPAEIINSMVSRLEITLADDGQLSLSEFESQFGTVSPNSTAFPFVIATPLSCSISQNAEAAFAISGPDNMSSKFTITNGFTDNLLTKTDNCPGTDGCFYVHTAGQTGWAITRHAANTLSTPINYVYIPGIFAGARCI
jgi:hypothetical protein